MPRRPHNRRGEDKKRHAPAAPERPPPPPPAPHLDDAEEDPNFELDSLDEICSCTICCHTLAPAFAYPCQHHICQRCVNGLTDFRLCPFCRTHGNPTKDHQFTQLVEHVVTKCRLATCKGCAQSVLVSQRADHLKRCPRRRNESANNTNSGMDLLMLMGGGEVTSPPSQTQTGRSQSSQASGNYLDQQRDSFRNPADRLMVRFTGFAADCGLDKTHLGWVIDALVQANRSLHDDVVTSAILDEMTSGKIKAAKGGEAPRQRSSIVHVDPFAAVAASQQQQQVQSSSRSATAGGSAAAAAATKKTNDKSSNGGFDLHRTGSSKAA